MLEATETIAHRVLGLTEAAAMLHMSEDALMRKARAGLIPGAKPGKKWVFLEVDLIEAIRAKYPSRINLPPKCRSSGLAKSGMSISATKGDALDALLAQAIGSRRRNTTTA